MRTPLGDGREAIEFDVRGSRYWLRRGLFGETLLASTLYRGLLNARMQAIGCVAARICNTNNCPAGIATQQAQLRARLNVDKSAQQLARFLKSSVELMQVMARACGHRHLNQFNADDITTWKKEMADLTGIQFAGVGGR